MGQLTGEETMTRFFAISLPSPRCEWLRLTWGQRVVAIAILGALVLAAGCHTDPNIKKQKYLESGKRYSAQGKHKEAAIQYANALKIDKSFAEAHYELAKSYRQLGQIGAAYSELARTVDLQPNNYSARVDFANVLLKVGKTDDSKAQADAVLAADPSNADAHALVSAIAFRNGQHDQALSEIQRALQLDPKRAAFHAQLALLESIDPANGASVESELKSAVSLDPTSAGPRILLAGFYVSKNRWPEAEQSLREAIAVEPKSLAAREGLARFYLRQSDQAKAESVLRQAANDLGDDPAGVRILADYYERSGQIEKARKEFEAIASRYPKSVALQEAYVQSLVQVKDYGKAQTVIADLMKQSKAPMVLALNGIVLLHGGKTDDALGALQTAIKDYPKDSFLQFWLGKAALAKGQVSLAEQSFRRVTLLNPPALQAQQELALIASQKGDLNLLSDVAEKTIASAPGFADAYVWRASVELAHNSVGEAEGDLQTAIKLAPSNSAAYLELGVLRFSQRKFSDGVELLEQALLKNPDSVQAMRVLLSYHLFRKHPEAALSRLKQQITNRPANSGFFNLLAEYHIQAKDLDQALASAQKAFQINPRDGQAIMLIARIQIQKGNTHEAIAAWEEWLSAHPRDAAVLAILGTLEDSTGNRAKAADYYKKSLEIQPEQPVAANNLAYSMLANGENVDLALTLAQTARRGMPNSPNTADTLAWAYYHKRAYAFARDLLEEAVKTDAANQTIQYHLGLVYRELRDKASAANHLRKAISLDPRTPTAKDATTALEGIGKQAQGAKQQKDMGELSV